MTVARVTSVIDGDTIRVSLDGRDTTVRIIGIDTPEKDGPYTEEECFGAQASTYAERAMDGATVGLEFDVDRTTDTTGLWRTCGSTESCSRRASCCAMDTRSCSRCRRT